MTDPAFALSTDGPLPARLIEAFTAYEAALVANDVAVLDGFFEDDAASIRSDAAGSIVGAEAIAAFRASRGGIAPRVITALRVRVLADDLAMLVSTSAPASGGSGTQTQLWRRGADGDWRMVVAHVTAPAPALDRAIWREVGSPLVAGAASGPLAGERVAVKDLYAVAGHAIGAGNPRFLAEQKPQSVTAPAVQALLDAGASVTGIAQTDEFAYSVAGRNVHYGTPANPAAPGTIPGGSSSGPATAVASGQVSIGLGSDTAGSVRVPASYQGLWGIRTTHGAVSLDAVHPLAPSFDTVGWLTRDGALLERVADMSLPLGRGRESIAEPVRFVVAPAVTALASPAVQAAFADAVAALIETGHVVEEVDLGDPAEPYALFRVMQPYEAWVSDGDWVTAHAEDPGALAPDVAERFRIASEVTREQYDAAAARAIALRGELDAALAGRVLLVPSASSTAPSLASTPDEIQAARWSTLEITSIAGLGGYPAVSVPLLEIPVGEASGVVGVTHPAGVCLVGPRDTDLALLRIAVETYPGA